MQFTLNSTTWDIPQRYQNLTVVGAGAYGRVCSADDTRVVSKEGVALKVVIKKECQTISIGRGRKTHIQRTSDA